MKNEVEEKLLSSTKEISLKAGQPSQLQRKAEPQPWPDFFLRSNEHRPSTINHQLLAMEKRPTDILGQQRQSTISGGLPMLEHKPYNNEHQPITIGHQPPEHLSSIINHRALEARQIPNLVFSKEGNVPSR